MKEFLPRAKEPALAAGSLIRDSWQKLQQIQYKSPIDLVTTLGLQSERCIVDILRGYFPEHAILVEEGPPSVTAGTNTVGS
jgi:fructose-1,6-bisphosphatase/inositol monophosphatase family enzyme